MKVHKGEVEVRASESVEVYMPMRQYDQEISPGMNEPMLQHAQGYAQA